ncbi:uncharacterized protein PHALS_06522 [Plasmopara halstedii]|uniref:Uncharacterized protein n=1 Tax=Plasmopara halstedii TaxID=4781 RepID=A0A0P1B331_PLAHL|nr:uncharacterized protein PHALS_06522 [Plasmopara halstedii]CEG48709.1 hypothetical protein PHALS_06522 [Plasmopara halstedii]|eukprot:XP_024585078.1 hypothetical protein PHALS_06522 [Plasmopara halstedii]
MGRTLANGTASHQTSIQMVDDEGQQKRRFSDCARKSQLYCSLLQKNTYEEKYVIVLGFASLEQKLLSL